jgi:hypothetical protein
VKSNVVKDAVAQGLHRNDRKGRDYNPGDADNCKSRRGGKRPGSERKPNYLKRLGIKVKPQSEILAHFSEIDLWLGLLKFTA